MRLPAPICSPKRGSCSRSRHIPGSRSSARTSSWTSGTSSRWTGSRARISRRRSTPTAAAGSTRRSRSATSNRPPTALEHLHTHDPTVVHGDVKPANLILTSSGRIVLVDFGLSSRPTDDLRRAGTAGYVAAEVAAGARPTAASDVYSLAATAVALLTGEPPSGGAPNWGAIERGGSRRWSGSCARTWPSTRDAGTHRRQPSSPGCGDGGAPPSRGERSRSCWPT